MPNDAINTSTNQTESLTIDTTLPEPTNTNTAQFNDVNNSVGSEQGALVDTAGTVFDPSIHVARKVADEWIPVRKKSGEFRKRRTRINIEGAQTSGNNSTVIGGVELPNDPKLKAKFLSSLYGQAHMVVYGPEGYDPKLLEPVSDAIERLIIEEGDIYLPPKLQLTLAMGVYSFSIAMKDKCIDKTKKIKDFVLNFFKRKEPKSQAHHQLNTESI